MNEPLNRNREWTVNELWTMNREPEPWTITVNLNREPEPWTWIVSQNRELEPETGIKYFF